MGSVCIVSERVLNRLGYYRLRKKNNRTGAVPTKHLENVISGQNSAIEHNARIYWMCCVMLCVLFIHIFCMCFHKNNTDVFNQIIPQK